MSLQRIIELARRQGMPVILTDVAGREPMVVLPLEAYEKMLDVPRVGQEEGGSKFYRECLIFYKPLE
jgi:nicotinamidase-related amidase